MLQTVAHYNGREGKYCAPNIGNRSEEDTGSYKILLRMTDIMTSQNIDLSSWDILYSPVWPRVALIRIIPPVLSILNFIK
jgi:hypothetical protein